MLVDTQLKPYKLTLLLLWSLLAFSCSTEKKSNGELLFELNCDLSSTEKKHSHPISSFKSITVSNGATISNKEFHSAPSSIFLSDKKKYAFVTKLKDLDTDQFIRVSIWRKDSSKKSSLIVSGESSEVFYVQNPEVVEVGKNGWEKLQLEFDIPSVVSEISIYGFLSKSDSAYFDDLNIEVYSGRVYKEFANETKLHLHFSEKKMEKFDEERDEAFIEGVHFSNDSWRKGILSDGDEVLPMKARLKGDWLDHLQGRKMSFRIKMRKGNTFRRLKAFSIQTPRSRYFLHEYLSHLLFKSEDILTTRYDFIPVTINENNVGIYAIEEHFAKQLIESNLRREGPILKLDEDPFWRSLALHYGLGRLKKWHAMPHYQASRVLPFASKSIAESPSLHAQFNIAHSLVYQYKNQKTPIQELFDLDKLAKHLALTDLINGKHGSTWHNQRFYYNPVLCKLEPINYDNFTENFHLEGPAIPEALKIKKKEKNTPGKVLNATLFSSKELMQLYYDNLKIYSKEEYVRSFYQKHTASISEKLLLIQEEFPDYSIDSSFLLNNAKDLRKHLPKLESKIQSGFFEKVEIKTAKPKVNRLNQKSILTNYLIAYYSKKDTESELLVENYNGVPVELIGLSDEDNDLLYRFPPRTILESFKESYDSTTLEIPFFEKAIKIAFKTLDTNRIVYAELTPWKKNVAQSPYQELLHSEKSNPLQLFEERNDTLLLRSGEYELTERILIPSGKKVVFEENVLLDLSNEASIISHSPVFLNGTSDGRIKITSSDFTANGIVVLQAASKSIVRHTTFSGLNTLDYKGWTLTGAVNFYESDVDISNTSFVNNQCEDALNIIRSDFSVKSTSFIDIYADAFDSDFCTGLLEDSEFDRVGNDAIDFSTSQIKIRNCDINNINDKGISGGEASTLNVEDCRISNCNIGVASKDLTMLSISNSTIKDCKYGFVALKKKAEYGGANIVANSIQLENCSTDDLIELGSSLELNGKKIKGSENNVAELFY